MHFQCLQIAPSRRGHVRDFCLRVTDVSNFRVCHLGGMSIWLAVHLMPFLIYRSGHHLKCPDAIVSAVQFFGPCPLSLVISLVNCSLDATLLFWMGLIAT